METEKLIAEAMKKSFAMSISEGSGMPFSETGVSMPSDKVWLRYARDVAAALSTPPHEAGSPAPRSMTQPEVQKS